MVSYEEAYADKVHEQNPQAEVLTVAYDSRHEPWTTEDLVWVCNTIFGRIYEFPCNTPDFKVRKTLLEDEKILRFQRSHPRMYYTITDRNLMKVDKYRVAIQSLITTRAKVESGHIPDDKMADAFATQAIINSLK